MNYSGDIQQNEIESIVTDALTLLRVANPTLPNQYQLPLRLPAAEHLWRGYFYQLDVSILTALDLVLAKRVARQLVLEPATQEVPMLG
jgi:hypothetical protein